MVRCDTINSGLHICAWQQGRNRALCEAATLQVLAKSRHGSDKWGAILNSVGIVTISFNSGVFLEQAVRSVLSSSLPDLRYVVKDALSTDGSSDFLESIHDDRLQVVREPDHGPADGLNRGVELLSDCEIIGFINADDVLLPGALEHVVDFFQSYPRAMVLQGAGLYIDGSGSVTGRYYPRRYSSRLARRRVTALFQPSVFFRKIALPMPPFATRNRSCWDSQLMYRLAGAKLRVYRTPRVLSAFRLHSESISGSGRLTETYIKEEEEFLGPLQGNALGRLCLSSCLRIESYVYALTHKPNIA